MLIVVFWIAIFMIGLVQILNEDLGPTEAFLWAAIGLPLCSVLYFIISPGLIVWGLPVFFKKIIQKYIVRTKNAD